MSRAPIHIMRMAPSDYVNDPAVQLALVRREMAALAFYPLFLFRSHMEGGSLPARRDLLAAAVGMREPDVARALAFWMEHGKVVEVDGRLFNRRVAEEVVEEIAYRESQVGYGKLGGRPRKAAATENNEKGTLSDDESPPAPAPAPAPTPAPEPAGSPDFASQELRDECWQMLKRVVAVAGPATDGQIELTRASRTPNGRVIERLDAPKLTTAWVRNTLKRLTERLLSLEADAAGASGAARASPRGNPGLSEVQRQGLERFMGGGDAGQGAIRGGDGETGRGIPEPRPQRE